MHLANTKLSSGQLTLPVLLMSMALAFALFTPSSASALTEADLEPVGERDENYLRTLSGSRTNADVTYLRPSADFKPDEAVRIDVPERADEQRDDMASRWVIGLIFGAFLVVVLLILWRYGNTISVSFNAPTQGRRETNEAGLSVETSEIAGQPMDQFLESLRAMKDRREALILLVSRALERAAEANDVRLGRAQTARDVVRVLPKSWSQIGTLRRLVREVEVVHFGGRDLTEDTWEECLRAALPIFREGHAA
jgi:uncharacterized integral membrane protein